MIFNFLVDEGAIAMNLLQRNRFFSVDYKNKLMELHKDEYILLTKKHVFDKDETKNIIEEIKKTEVFKTQYEKCKNNAVRISSNLKPYQNIIEVFLEKLSKTSLPNLNLNVYIVPHGGYCASYGIVWGHHKGYEDKFYDLVYLYHEALHKVFKKDDISHVIIQNLADIELSKFLNSQLTNGYNTHKYLKPLEEQLLPYWQIYLNSTQGQFIEKTSLFDKKDSLQISDKYKTKISAMNIFEFENFLHSVDLNTQIIK